jgi:hypothetical protein
VFHAILLSVFIEFSRCIGTYSSAKYENIIKKQATVIKIGTKAESRVSGCVQRGCMITCPAPYPLHKCYHGVTVLRSIKSEKSNAVSTPNIDKAAKKQYNMRNYISSALKNFKIFVT